VLDIDIIRSDMSFSLLFRDNYTMASVIDKNHIREQSVCLGLMCFYDVGVSFKRRVLYMVTAIIMLRNRGNSYEVLFIY